MPTVPVVVRLQLPDGRIFDCSTTVETAYADSQAYWWTEGNGGCDCNRSLYLNREHGLGLVDSDAACGDEGCLRCGDTITLLALTVNGVPQEVG